MVYVAAAGLVKQKAVTSAATMWAISSWCTPILLVDTKEPTVGSNTAAGLGAAAAGDLLVAAQVAVAAAAGATAAIQAAAAAAAQEAAAAAAAEQ